MIVINTALEQLRTLARELGAERVNVTVRQDGRVYIEIEDAHGNTPHLITADLDPDSEIKSPHSALFAAIPEWRRIP